MINRFEHLGKQQLTSGEWRVDSELVPEGFPETHGLTLLKSLCYRIFS